jgi:glycosyltransferase involved in cell wall biosynthesis
MKDRLLTVLMAVHNDEKYVEKAVRSILEQTYKDFELLIIADCSSDNSIDIIERMGDFRIRIERNPVCWGLTRSLNRGLSLSKGRLIARMDADDIAYPTRLKNQFDFLTQNPEYGLVGSWFREIDEKGQPISEVKTPETDAEIKAALRKGNTFAHSSVMYPRHCIEKVNGYREFFEFSQDYDLFLRLTAEFKAHNLPEILLDWRIRLDSVSVRFKVLQDLYAEMARECAYSNVDLPSDQDEWLKHHIGSSLQRSRTSAIGYYKWAAIFFYNRTSYKRRIYSCIRLLFRSLVANPATFARLCSHTMKNAGLRFLHSLKIKSTP